jgi:uncharacterized lipoprotein
MMMSSTRNYTATATAIFLLLLTACSSGEKRPEYYDAEEVAPLQIPEGLEKPDAASALVIASPKMPPPTMVMETKPPRISSTTSGINANSSFTWSSQGLYLKVLDSPDSAHRRLGLVIDRAGMEKVRIDDEGVYRFDYYQRFEDEGGFFSKLAFWSRDKSEDYSGAYQLYVRPDGRDNARVYVKYADGTDCEPDAAEHLLAVIRSRMG